MKQNKQFFRRLLAVAFWLAVWQAAAMAIGQEVFLVSPVQALCTLVQLLPRADFWQRVGFSSGRILLGFVLGAVVSVVLAVCAARWSAADALLAPGMQLVKATPVASFIILALVWVRGSALSVLISFLMVLPVLYGAVRTGIAGADVQLLEMAAVFRLPPGRRLRAIWLPAVLPAFRGVHLHAQVGEERRCAEPLCQVLKFQHFAPSSPSTAPTALSSANRNSFSKPALSRMMTKVHANSSPVERVILAR